MRTLGAILDKAQSRGWFQARRLAVRLTKTERQAHRREARYQTTEREIERQRQCPLTNITTAQPARP
jgi:hypothetical protein